MLHLILLYRASFFECFLFLSALWKVIRIVIHAFTISFQLARALCINIFQSVGVWEKEGREGVRWQQVTRLEKQEMKTWVSRKAGLGETLVRNNSQFYNTGGDWLSFFQAIFRVRVFILAFHESFINFGTLDCHVLGDGCEDCRRGQYGSLLLVCHLLSIHTMQRMNVQRAVLSTFWKLQFNFS
jgi:hypothetical protein